MDFEEMLVVARKLKQEQDKAKSEQEKFDEDVKNLSEIFELDEQVVRSRLREEKENKKQAIVALGICGVFVGAFLLCVLMIATGH